MKLPQLARKTLEFYFKRRRFIPDKKTKEKYSEKKACFVTLIKNGELRGCIGDLEPKQELWRNVQKNAINAAFNDFRFSPLTEKELEEIKIEISILSIPKRIYFKNEKALLTRLNKNKGIVLRRENYCATFLPQVWEKIPDKIIFLEQLSLKAGLNKDAWKNAEISSYSIHMENEN